MSVQYLTEQRSARHRAVYVLTSFEDLSKEAFFLHFGKQKSSYI